MVINTNKASKQANKQNNNKKKEDKNFIFW